MNDSWTRWLFVGVGLVVLLGGFAAHHFTGRLGYLAGTFFVVSTMMATHGLITGKVELRGVTIRRNESSIWYWSVVLMWAMFAVGFSALTWLTWLT